jgi:flagellar biosynthetic protein FliR
MVALFMVEVALALVARTSPQMHIMEFGFPIKIGVGFLFVGMLLVVMSDNIEQFVSGLDGLFANLLRALGTPQ